MVKLNSQTTRDLEDSGIAVELSVHHTSYAGVGNRLKTRPARRGRYIEIRSVDGNPVFGGMNDGILFGMNGRDTVIGFEHVSHFIAVWHATDGPVISRRQDGSIAHDDGTDLFAGTG